MKILILNWRDPKNPESGGAEIVTHMHAKAWLKAGHKVTWFTSSFKGAVGHEIVEGIEIIRKGTSRTVRFFAPSYYLFNKHMFNLVIDEIHGLPFYTPLYVHKPIIAFIHEVADEIWDTMYPFPINVIGKLLELFSFIFYRNITFWTDAPSTIDELAAHGIPREHCKAIPCPIVNTPIHVLPIKEHNPTFLFVSRVVKMKGVEEIIRAFQLITHELPNARLWIVGKGEDTYIQKLIRLSSDLGIPKKHIQFFGHVSEAKKLECLRRAHLLLHASIKEGWGLVVLEAASQGTPTIAYNVSGLRDTVKHGETGIVVTQNTPEELAKASIEIMNNKKRYRIFQKNGLDFVRSFTWKNATERSLALLQSQV